jgi:YD repeat-containing protein
MERQTRLPRRTCAPVLLAVIAAVFGRVSASAPLPGQANVPAAGCRTYSTDATWRSTRGTMEVRCTFDKTTNQHVCHQDGPNGSFVQTTQFGSVADFVGDPSKVSFFPRARAITVKFPSSTSTQVYSYDGQGRLSAIATSSSTGGSTVQTFSAWDPLGRPTAAHDEVQTFSFTYDDAQRIFTQKSAGALITLTLDANGNHVTSTTVSATFKDTTTTTIHSTAQVCK